VKIDNRMSENDKIKIFKQRIDSIKSGFISLATTSENMISLTFSEHYCLSPQQAKEFQSIFFSDDLQISFHDKIIMLEKFLNKNYPDFLKNNPELINKLNRIRKLRNNFAHSFEPKPDRLKKLMENEILELEYLEDGIIKKHSYPFTEIQERTNDSKDVHNILVKLYEKIVEDKQEIYKKLGVTSKTITENSSSS